MGKVPRKAAGRLRGGRIGGLWPTGSMAFSAHLNRHGVGGAGSVDLTRCEGDEVKT
jgi:hypothetical protein